MYHIEGTKLRYKAFIPPRVPVHDFHSGREPPASEWQPERYPFENDTEFVEIDEEAIAPEPREPEKKAQKADSTAEVLAETGPYEKKGTVYAVRDDSIDSSRSSFAPVIGVNRCRKVSNWHNNLLR